MWRINTSNPSDGSGIYGPVESLGNIDPGGAMSYNGLMYIASSRTTTSPKLSSYSISDSSITRMSREDLPRDLGHPRGITI